MTSEKLYWGDSYLCDFEAHVVGLKVVDEYTEVILDRTAFYPTSGGQMHDRGRLDGYEVFEVIERDGEIVHLVRGTFREGDAVVGRIDWQRRFDFMQQHSGFHILAQSFLRAAEAPTLSSHLGEETSTIDLEIDVISGEKAEEAEALANRIIYENRRITSFIADSEQLVSLKLRKTPQLDKNIRIVEIENFDLDPCSGTHTRTTGEVGCIKLLGAEKIRGNVRYEFLAGARAHRDYVTKNDLVVALCDELTTGPADILAAVKKMKEDIRGVERRYGSLAEKYIALFAEQIGGQAACTEVALIERMFENMDWDQVRKLALTILNDTGVSVVFAQTEPAMKMVVATKRPDRNLREIVPQLCELLDGKGGGRPDFVEIGGKNRSNLEAAFERVKEFLE